MWIRLQWIAVDPLLIVVLTLLAGTGQLPVGLLYLGLILVHELAHGLVAHRFGLRVVRIELTPFGGRAHIPQLNVVDPSVEIAIALAGPLMNLVLAAGAGLVADALGAVANREMLMSWQQVNLSLVVFNLLPGLPLDGGRIVRALLAPRIGWVAATRRAARWGEWCGLAAALMGVLLIWRAAAIAGISFALTGVFLLVAARQEGASGPFSFQHYVLDRVSGPGLSPGEMREGRWLVAGGGEPLQAVVQRFLPHRYHLIMVVDRGGRPRGWVGEGEVFALARQHGLGISLKDAVELSRRRGVSQSPR